MTGAMMPILSYGSAPAAACDLEFIAEELEASGISTRPGNVLGTLISTSAFFDSLGGAEFALVTLGPGFMQLIFNADVLQTAFTSLTVTEWGETFTAASATYSNTPGVDTFFSWFTNVGTFVNAQQYCVTFVPP